jgi:hypothetical protein
VEGCKIKSIDMILDDFPQLSVIQPKDLYQAKIRRNFSFDPLTDWDEYDELDKIEFIMELERIHSISISDDVADWIFNNGWGLFFQHFRDIKLNILLND